MTFRTIAIFAALLALAACGKGGKSEDGTKTYEGKGATFDDALADARKKMDKADDKDDGDGGWQELTPEDGGAYDLAVKGLDALYGGTPDEIVAKIDAYWREGGRAAAFDKTGYDYRIDEGEKLKPSDLAGGNSGVKAASGVSLVGKSGPYEHALVSFGAFDDEETAAAFEAAHAYDTSLGVSGWRGFEVTKKGYPTAHVECAIVPGSQGAMACLLRPTPRVVVTVAAYDGPAYDQSYDGAAVDFVLENDDARARLGAIASVALALAVDAQGAPR